MTRTFSYAFEELPLLIDDDGFEAGLVNGEARIACDRDGTWTISSIWFDGYRRTAHTLADRVEALRVGRSLPVFDRRPVQVEAPSALFLAIHDRLEREWRGKVQDAVNEAIDEDRECTADDHADMTREERMMERMP